jgi:hypothetical protein
MIALVLAGFCFPVMVILTWYHVTGALWLYLAGPAALIAGCILYIAGLIYARYALGWRPPVSYPTWVYQLLAVYWGGSILLLALQHIGLQIGPVLLTEVLFAIYPFMLALAPWQTILSPLQTSAPPFQA